MGYIMWEGAVWITGDGPTSIYGDVGTQDVIEYIRRVSDIKREWSTPGRVRKWCRISWIYLYWNMYMDESEDITYCSFTIIQLGQFPRKLKCYKNASRLNRYSFPTDNAIGFLFSTLHTTPFHYEVLKIGSR